MMTLEIRSTMSPPGNMPKESKSRSVDGTAALI